MLFPCFSIWHIFQSLWFSDILQETTFQTLFIGIPQKNLFCPSFSTFITHTNVQGFFWLFSAALKFIHYPKIYGKPWLKKCKFFVLSLPAVVQWHFAFFTICLVCNNEIFTCLHIFCARFFSYKSHLLVHEHWINIYKANKYINFHAIFN